MRPALLAPRLILALASMLTLTAADCGDDDGPPPVDGPSTIDAGTGTDAPSSCNLPSTIIHCTVGDNAPCTAVCDTSYCYNYQQFGVVCTKACTVIGDCPAGWSCNMMGRCRPPG